MSRKYVLAELCDEHRLPTSYPLEPGKHVKVCFQLPEPVEIENGSVGSETMWVLLTDVQGDELRGTVDNDPVFVTGLSYQDEVNFNRKHVRGVFADN